MKKEKKVGDEVSTPTVPAQAAPSPRPGVTLPQEEEHMTPFDSLIREFLAWRRRTGREAPPVTAADVEEARRRLMNPTDEDRVQAERHIERYNQRRARDQDEG